MAFGVPTVPGRLGLINTGTGVKGTRLDLAKLIAEIGLVFGNWKQQIYSSRIQLIPSCSVAVCKTHWTPGEHKEGFAAMVKAHPCLGKVGSPCSHRW